MSEVHKTPKSIVVFGKAAEQTRVVYCLADAASRASLARHLLDLQDQIGALNGHVQELLKATALAAKQTAVYH